MFVYYSLRRVQKKLKEEAKGLVARENQGLSGSIEIHPLLMELNNLHQALRRVRRMIQKDPDFKEEKLQKEDHFIVSFFANLKTKPPDQAELVRTFSPLFGRNTTFQHSLKSLFALSHFPKRT